MPYCLNNVGASSSFSSVRRDSCRLWYLLLLLVQLGSGVGSSPTIHVEGLETAEIRLLCRSAGWFPEPRVQWRDSTGKTLSMVSDPIISRDADDLYRMEVGFTLRKENSGVITCSILNPLLKQEKESSVNASDYFFSQDNSCLRGLAVSGALNVIFLLSIAACLWTMYRRRGLFNQWN
ncbi:butyrophilin-like protein 1 isoform X4 [Ornithorhynchus anatinus]|uniref:butyrophilin-like protein 1 isoform X4 n=1 Tax=Ornithorhynchus anatinus TaxID=9258 RepID=UPI0019D41B69|nr:butyrophilin-like protein 1 isoform X4 [Ornithorhynchus anatinus]